MTLSTTFPNWPLAVLSFWFLRRYLEWDGLMSAPLVFPFWILPLRGLRSRGTHAWQAAILDAYAPGAFYFPGIETGRIPCPFFFVPVTLPGLSLDGQVQRRATHLLVLPVCAVDSIAFDKRSG